jgi:acyl-CoA synthetase (AMP-forming)/AMP-acid ligase II
VNLAEPLAHHARARADYPAIVHGDRVVSYRELDPLVRRTGSHLLSLGLAPGDVVGVALRDSVEHLVMLFALARAGIVLLPLDWRWTAPEQARVAAHFGAKRIVVEPDAAAPDGQHCTAIDDAWHRAVADANPAREFPTGDGPLLMSLSSGTTGRPKGPRLSHYQFLRRFWVHWINLGFNSEDRYVSATPLYYGGGRTFAMLMLYSGGTVSLFPPPYEPAALCAEVARREATAVFLVPTLLRRLLAATDAALAPMRSLRLLLSSGSALHADERRRIRARISPNLIEYYSSTEGGGISYLTSRDAAHHDDSVGRPVFAVDVECVDESHRPLPPGVVGRIRYRGPAVADGFWNDPEASREAFRDGWYYPGDLGMLDDEGFLFLKGRAKDMIIRGGINIYPADVEAVLQSHPAVAEAAVVGWPSREFNEEVAAFVTLKGAASAPELRDLCRARLASYKVPREVFIVPELPRNTLGKIVKTELSGKLPQL